MDAQQWPEALSLAHGIESEALARAAAHPVPGGAGLSKAARFAALPAAIQRDIAAAKALVAHTHLTHAEWLAVNDRYEEAQASWRRRSCETSRVFATTCSLSPRAARV